MGFLQRLKSTSISKSKPCFINLLVCWKDIEIGWIRVNAFPDTRVFQLEALAVKTDCIDRDPDMDVVLSCAYPAYRVILTEPMEDWTVEVRGPYGWGPERAEAHAIIMRNLQLPTGAAFEKAVLCEIQNLQPNVGATQEGMREYMRAVRRFATRVAKALGDADVTYRASVNVEEVVFGTA
jgi:hypothetical protein